MTGSDPSGEIDEDLEPGKVKADILVKFLFIGVKRIRSSN